MNFKLSFYTVFSKLTFSDIIKPCIYSTRTGNTLFVDESHLQQIHNKEFKKLPSQLVEKLIKFKIIVPENENEFESCLEENKIFTSDSKVLSYTIQPTGQCQLGCGYCGQEHRNIVMSDKIIDSTFERIKSMALNGNYEGIDITWYGGEPLIASKQIHTLSDRLISFCKENNIEYTADIITNGLSINSIDKIKKLVINSKIKRYQITVDSFAEYHDKRRPLKKGGGSFEKIMSNIKMFVNDGIYTTEECKISLRMNIDKENSESIDSFIEFLASNDLQGKIDLSFSTVFDWGGNNADSNSFTPIDFSQLEINWMLKAKEFGFNFSNFLPKRSYEPCMVVDPNSEVYDAYGNIYSCYELPYTPKYEEAENLVGNVLVDNFLDINTDTPLRQWNSLIKNEGIGCSTCNFFPVCGGGCPKTWLEGNPACPSFKFNIDELIAMEYINEDNSPKTTV